MTEEEAEENNRLVSLWASAKKVGDHDSESAKKAYRQAAHTLEEEFGYRPAPRDVMWRLMQEWVLEIPDPFQQARGYYYKAEFLHKEGRDWSRMKALWREAKRRSHEEELREYAKSSVVKKVEILGRGCEACQKLDGRVLSIEEALKNGPLPCEDCTTWEEKGVGGWCRCSYVACTQLLG